MKGRPRDPNHGAIRAHVYDQGYVGAPLTERQFLVLTLIADGVTHRREMRARMGSAASSAAQDHIAALEKRGLVTRRHRQVHGNIEVTDEGLRVLGPCECLAAIMKAGWQVWPNGWWPSPHGVQAPSFKFCPWCRRRIPGPRPT